mgnify:FL=1
MSFVSRLTQGRRGSVAAKLFWTFVPLATAAVAVLGWTTYNQSRNSLLQATEQSTLQQLDLVGDTIEGYLQRAGNLTKAARAYQEGFGHEVAPDFVKFTARLLETLPQEAAF